LTIPSELSPLFSNLRALEALECPLIDLDVSEDNERENLFDFKPLQLDVMAQSTKLRKLLNSDYAPIQTSLNGLVTLGLPQRDYYESDPVFHDLVGVEELVFTAVSSHSYDVHLGHPLPALRKLKYFGNVVPEPSAVFSQITHLAVHFCWFDYHQNKIAFPALKVLVMQDSWDVVGAITAPNLHEMAIYGDFDDGIRCEVSFCPEVLHIDEFLAIDAPYLLGHLSIAWKNVKRLHITIPHVIPMIEVFEAFLPPRGEERSVIACPNMEYLSILYPVIRCRRSKNEPKKCSSQVSLSITDVEWARVDSRMNQVLQSARGKGLMRRLKGFRHGLYILEEFGNHFAESRRWWRTEWKEIITG
jgi:hypothetical protein